MTKYGYCRVSSVSQSLDSQIDDIVKYGVDTENIFTDKISGVKENKESFNRLMDVLKEGDTLIVSRWDRLSRSLLQLLQVVEDITNKGVNLISIHENIDFSTPTGKLMLSLFGMMAQFNRDVIKERQREGIEAKRSRGLSVGGRPKISKDKVEAAIDIYLNDNKTVNEICSIVGISRSTLYKGLKERDIVRA